MQTMRSVPAWSGSSAGTMDMLHEVPSTRLGAECADLRRRFTGPSKLPSSRIAAVKPQFARSSPTPMTWPNRLKLTEIDHVAFDRADHVARSC